MVEADLDTFDAEFASEAGASQYQWFGFTSSHGLRDGLLGGTDNMLAVQVGGELAGRVEWLERRWGRRVERIQTTTDPENLAELKCLRNSGFVQQGVVPRAQWRTGRWHGQVLFSLLRNEFEAERPADLT